MFALVLAACGDGGYTQEELDVAVAEAVEEALSEFDQLQTTTTTGTPTTTTTAAIPATTNPPSSTTTTTAPVELDESDPRNSPAIEGNVSLTLAAGEAGVLSVIGAAYDVSDFGSTSVFLIVRNNTDESVKGIEVAFTIRDGGGGLIASGETFFSLRPYRVAPGEIAFGDALLSDTALPDDAQFEFQMSTSDRSESRDTQFDLAISEHVLQGDKVVAIVSNNTAVSIRLASAGVMCFLEDGLISWYADQPVDLDVIPVGNTSPVTVDMRDAPCPIYLIASQGFED